MHRTLFASTSTPSTPPPAMAKNKAGGRAYERSAEEALAQFAVTSTLNDTFYAKAEDQLKEVLALAAKCDPDVVADCAIYGRHGHMKDLPALLVAHLAARGETDALYRAFPRVIDNGRQIRSFVQMLRSGQLTSPTGKPRKSIPQPARRLVEGWFAKTSPDALYRASVGDKPSLADVVNMIHPKPTTPAHAALFRHILGKPAKDGDELPPLAAGMLRFRASKKIADLPEDAPFMMSTAHVSTPEGWKALAERATWTETRINLATFARHGVFESKRHRDLVVERLTNRDLIGRTRVMPYEILNAYLNAEGLPTAITNALQDALDLSLDNVPALDDVAICVDVSSSMSGGRVGGGKTRPIDVAALFACAILRKNPNAAILPFDTRVHQHDLNPRDSVVTNAKKLSRYGGGGTACGAPVAMLVEAGKGKRNYVKSVVMLSDNESWADRSSFGFGFGFGSPGTGLSTAWAKLKQSNPAARLYCIDLTPSSTKQTSDRPDTLNIGGFTDAVFSVIAAFQQKQTRSFLDVVKEGPPARE